MVCLVEDIINTDAWNKLEHSAYSECVGCVQVYYAIARSIVIGRIIGGRLETAVEVHTKSIVAPDVIVVGTAVKLFLKVRSRTVHVPAVLERPLV